MKKINFVQSARVHESFFNFLVGVLKPGEREHTWKGEISPETLGQWAGKEVSPKVVIRAYGFQEVPKEGERVYLYEGSQEKKEERNLWIVPSLEDSENFLIWVSGHWAKKEKGLYRWVFQIKGKMPWSLKIESDGFNYGTISYIGLVEKESPITAYYLGGMKVPDVEFP